MRTATPLAVTSTLAVVAVIGFAGNSLLARAALGGGLIGPGSFTAIRLAAGATMLLPWLLRGKREWPAVNGALALLIYCAAFSFAYLALTAATGAMVLFASVQATIFLAGRLTGAPMRVLDIVGVALAMIGVAVLLGTSLKPGPLLALASMVVAGIAWGIYTLLGRSTADPARRTAGNFLLAALLALPLTLLDKGQIVSTSGVLLASASGAFASGLGYVAWYVVVPRLPHATVGAAQLATPALAAIAGSTLLGEPLTVRLAIASLLILGGIAATLKRPAGEPAVS